MGDPETLHQIKLIAKNVQLLEDLLYSHNHRHVYNGGDPLFGLDASQIETGVFDIDRIPVMDDAHIPDVETLSYTNPFALAQIPTPLKSKILSEVFTAGADITAGQVVAITGDNEVSPADNTLRSQTIGVALNDAAVGEQVEVIIYGKTTVVADGVISAGDPLAAATTAGRVVSLLSHSHTNPDTSSVDLAHTHTNPNTSTTGSHTHGFTPSGIIGTTSINHRHSYTPAGSISSVSAGTPSGSISSESAGTPSGSIVSAGSHYHTQPDTGGPSATVTGITSLIWGTKYAATSSGGSPTQSFYAVKGYSPIILPSGTHNHSNPNTDAAGAHVHTFTGNALAGHSHTFTGNALPTHSHTFSGSTGYTSYWDSSGIGHRHSQGSTGSAGTHAHTQGSTGSAGDHHHTIGATGSALGTHNHTQENTGAVNNAQIVGKALTAAAAAGESISILVCLAG